ncbi:cold shock domain-containing protein [Halothiobacillus sp. DCM-1]
MPPAREAGLVKFFDAEKGFGFIVRANGEDLFVHYRSLANEQAPALVAGQTVEYHIGPGRKGPQAEAVTVLSTPS